ncbi:MAG: hypothetical protein QM541_06020 [Flavobacterium sp.]|nr:hypothetical protein [Flavobacterium sp.]
MQSIYLKPFGALAQNINRPIESAVINSLRMLFLLKATIVLSTLNTTVKSLAFSAYLFIIINSSII